MAATNSTADVRAQSRSNPVRRSSSERARPHDAQGRSPSDFSPLCQFQCILNIDAEIPDCVLNLGMAKQDLDRSKVTSCLIDHGSLRSPKGMRPVVLPTQPNSSDPLIDQSGVLPSAEMICVVYSTGKGIVIDCSSSSLKPCKQISSDLGRNLELHGASSLLLDDHRTSSNFVARDEGPDFHFYQIAAAELAVDGKIEQCTSLILPSRSRKKRTAQIWRCFGGFLTPTCLPAFQAGRSSAAGSYCEIPISVLLWPPFAGGRTHCSRFYDGAGRGLCAVGIRNGKADASALGAKVLA